MQIEQLQRELTTTREKLEATEKERDKLIQQEELVEDAIPGGEFEGSEDTNGEIVATIVSQRDTALAELADVREKLETCTLQMEQYSRIMLKALAELAKVKVELKQREDRLQIDPGGSDKIDELESAMAWKDAELSRLRAESAAKDAALQQWMAGNAHAEREEWEAASAHYHEADRLAIIALSTTPPVCVPVEVVAKLVEALEAMHRGSLQNGNTRESSDIIWAGHKASKEARALAAPFLAKGDK